MHIWICVGVREPPLPKLIYERERESVCVCVCVRARVCEERDLVKSDIKHTDTGSADKLIAVQELGFNDNIATAIQNKKGSGKVRRAGLSVSNGTAIMLTACNDCGACVFVLLT